MARDIGPSRVVPAASAVGALAEPLAWSWRRMPGWRSLSCSPQRNISPAMVSEPTTPSVPTGSSA